MTTTLDTLTAQVEAEITRHTAAMQAIIDRLDRALANDHAAVCGDQFDRRK